MDVSETALEINAEWWEQHRKLSPIHDQLRESRKKLMRDLINSSERNETEPRN